MVGQTRASLIAQIGAMSTPKITEGRALDFSTAADNFVRGFNQGKGWRDDKLDAQKKEAYINALQGGNQDEINQAWSAYDPQGFANYQQDQAKRAEDRQWKLEDMEKQYDYNSRLLRDKLNGEFDLAKYKAGLAPQPQINDNPFNKKRIEKAASEMDANITKAEEMKAVFEQADNALKNISTGGILAKLTKDKPLFSNADEEAFDSAAAKSIDLVRKAGTGPMTDADARRYERATIDRGKDKATNQLLIDSGKIAADNAIAKEELRAEWISRSGDIDKFDQEWRGYLNRNPIFAKDGGININRQDARDWFYNPEGRTYAEPKSAQPTQAQKMKGLFGKSNGIQAGQKIGNFTVIGVE